MTRTLETHPLFEKIRALSPSKVAEVEDFVDFLRFRQDDQALTRAATQLSEASFSEIWDNEEDAVYDQL